MGVRMQVLCGGEMVYDGLMNEQLIGAMCEAEVYERPSGQVLIFDQIALVCEYLWRRIRDYAAAAIPHDVSLESFHRGVAARRNIGGALESAMIIEGALARGYTEISWEEEEKEEVKSYPAYQVREDGSLQPISEDDRLRNNAIRLAEHHREHCAGKECTISLHDLYVLLQRAGIEVDLAYFS